MIVKYDAYISNEAISTNLTRLANQVYKLLPSREEGLDWTKPLSTIIEEFVGMDMLLLEYHSLLFSLLCKLEGLYSLVNESDFMFFRKTIFECLNLIGELKKHVIK
jgi:hypothetical protein